MILDALLARNVTVKFREQSVTLRRPTVADLVAAQDAEKRGVFMPAFYCAAHVLDANGETLWKSHEELRTLSAPDVIALSRLIEPLYVEGLDLP